MDSNKDQLSNKSRELSQLNKNIEFCQKQEQNKDRFMSDDDSSQTDENSSLKLKETKKDKIMIQLISQIKTLVEQSKLAIPQQDKEPS